MGEHPLLAQSGCSDRCITYGQLAQIEHLTPRVKLSIARGLEIEHGFTIDYAKLIQPRVNDQKKETGNRKPRHKARTLERAIIRFLAWRLRQIIH
jgi:hypothetical protein